MARTRLGKRTGRPKAQDAPVTVEQILDAAFRAFATYGYDGVAVRTLNRELGVSHNLIHHRFVIYNAGRPELLGMMNIEGRLESERLAYIYDNYIEPSLAPLGRLLEYLQEEGRIRPIRRRSPSKPRSPPTSSPEACASGLRAEWARDVTGRGGAEFEACSVAEARADAAPASLGALLLCKPSGWSSEGRANARVGLR